MSGRLKGKVAAITGAASGFGATAARRFAAEGAKVVLGDIQIDAGEAIAAEIGDAAIFQECNVTSEDHVSGLVDTAISRFGKLDIMYNNAGIVGAAGPIATTPADEWHFTLDILINGVFYGVKHAARVMVPNEAGSIINMASTAGILGGQGPHAYATSKHAVIGLTKNTAAELARYGIRVNAIAPAGMATPWWLDSVATPTTLRPPKRSWLCHRHSKGALAYLRMSLMQLFGSRATRRVIHLAIRSRRMLVLPSVPGRCLTFLVNICRLSEKPASGVSKASKLASMMIETPRLPRWG